MSDYPVAFVDEAFIQRAGTPGVYLLAAVLVEGSDVDDTLVAARSAARGYEFHSTQLYHRGHVGVIEGMLDAIAEHAAWTAVVARTPIGDSNEIARQTSMQRLLTYLNNQRVRDVVLDVRGDPQEWRQARERGMKMPASNYRDLRTYRHMVTGREISSRMRLIHVDDRDQPGLWMADAVAWSARRALSTDEPQWWLRVADAATVLEAVTGKELRIEDSRTALPDGDRGPHTPGQSAQTVLLSDPYYVDPTGGHQGRGPGRYLSSLVVQAEQARSPASVVSVQVAEQLLTTVQALAADVADLRQQIGRGQPVIDHSPDRRPLPGTEPDGVHHERVEADAAAPELE